MPKADRLRTGPHLQGFPSVAEKLGSANRAPRGSQMDEAAVKAQVLGFMRRAGARRAAVVTAEFTLGSSGVRADLALLAERELIGIEIKTERDNLRRLPSQIEGYAKYFDHVVLVVSSAHLKGLAEIPLNGASVWLSDKTGITSVETGQQRAVSSASHIDLLTAEEKRNLLASGRPVRDHVCDVFAKRYGRTSDNFWRSVGGRAIRPDDVQLLSRFSERREAVKHAAQEREKRWQRWHETYASGTPCVA